MPEPMPEFYHPRRKRRWPYVALILLVALCCAGGGIYRATTTTTHAPQAPHAAPMTLPGTKAAGIGDGTYAVPSEVKPGTYATTVPDGTPNCYYARLKATDNELSSIIANGNYATGAHGLVTVKPTDKAVTFTGGCTWARRP